MTADWQTLEQAALTLGISSRTLHRRIVKGEFQTRLEAGRREVLVMAPDAPATASADPSAGTSVSYDTGDSSFSASDSRLSDNAGNVSHPVLALHEDRLRRTDLAILAYQQSVAAQAMDVRSAHRSLRFAWSLAAAAIIGVFIIGIWTTHSVTEAQADNSHLTDTVRQLSDTAKANARQADNWHQQADTASVNAARAQGELSAAKEQITQLTRAQATMQARFVIAPEVASDMSAKRVSATQPSKLSKATTQSTAQATAAAR